MNLSTVMFGLEDGTASLGLFGDMPEDGDALRPPHVQISVHVSDDGNRAALRKAAIREALKALNAARTTLEAELE